MMLLSLVLTLCLHAEAKPPSPPAWSAPVVCEMLVLGDTDVKKPLRRLHAEASAKLDQIRAAALAVPKVERKYFGQIVRATEAALGKHNLEFEKAANLLFMDIPHHMTILRAIAAFDPARPRLGLVEIDDAIRLRHKLDHYVNCREGNAADATEGNASDDDGDDD